jgi:hypothetical protein
VAGITLLETASADVPTPAADKFTLFFDDPSGDMAYKDEAGVVHTLTSGGAPSTAQYVTLATVASLTNERVLTAGVNVTLTDAGAGSTVTAAFQSGMTDEGNSGTADTINFTSRYRWTHKSTLTDNVTYTLTNPVVGGTYTILIFTGAGGFTATWPATVKWPAGTAPTITVTASRMDLVVLTWDGTNYYGSFNQNYTP